MQIQDLEKTGNLEFLARQVVEGFITGLHKSPFHGFSVEFAEHRLYNTGESTKHIDWKLYARTEKLFVKRFEEETNLRCYVILDTSSSMFYPEQDINKMKFSVYCAAAIMNLLKRQRDAYGFCRINEGLEYMSEIKSSGIHYRLMLEKLEECLQNAPRQGKLSRLSENLDVLAEKIHRRSLVLIFSDMVQSSGEQEKLFNSLNHLRFNKHEVILFHVQDKRSELDFDFSNRPYLFTDPETGEQLKVMPNEVKTAYTEAMSDFRKELKYRCGLYKVGYVEADAALDFDQVLIPFLIKRNKMV